MGISFFTTLTKQKRWEIVNKVEIDAKNQNVSSAYTDYGHTKAKSLILYSPNSNINHYVDIKTYFCTN